MRPGEIAQELLRANAITVHEALAGDPVPDKGGVYAWWADDSALPQVLTPTVRANGFRLLYIGIAPSRADSHSTLRSRIRGQHIRGTIATSTFRLGLAALLQPDMGWVPTRVGSKIRLDSSDNERLSEWQRQHLRVSWVVTAEPYEVEAGVIELMSPPMNRGHNQRHPYYKRMGDARNALRDAAR